MPVQLARHCTHVSHLAAPPNTVAAIWQSAVATRVCCNASTRHPTTISKTLGSTAPPQHHSKRQLTRAWRGCSRGCGCCAPPAHTPARQAGSTYCWVDLITVACWRYAAVLLPPILLLRDNGNKPGSISDCSPAAGMRTGRFTTMLAASQSSFRLTHAKPTDSRSPWRSDQGRSGRTPPGSSPGQLSSALECSCRPMAQVFYSSRYLRAAGIFTKGNRHW